MLGDSIRDICEDIDEILFNEAFHLLPLELQDPVMVHHVHLAHISVVNLLAVRQIGLQLQVFIKFEIVIDFVGRRELFFLAHGADDGLVG
jgi:hypothetical protein